MAKIERFEDIEARKASHEVAKIIYEMSKKEPFCRDFAFVNQIRRAALSVVSNIAEGFERDGNKEFLNFLAIGKGSCGEVRAQLYVAFDQNYIDESMFRHTSEKLIEVSRRISGLMRYLQQSDMRGRRFQQPGT